MDKLICGGRATGKTHRLLTEALKVPGAVVIVRDELSRDYTAEMARRLLQESGLSSIEARKHAQDLVQTARYRADVSSIGSNRAVYLDDLGWILDRFLGGGPVKMATWDGPLETPQGKPVKWWIDSLYLDDI